MGGFQFQGSDPFKLFEQFFGGPGQGGGGMKFNFGGAAGSPGFGGFDMGGFQMNGMDGAHGQRRRASGFSQFEGGKGRGGGSSDGYHDEPRDIYAEEKHIMILSSAKFPDAKSKHIYLIQYYSSADNRCISFKPMFIKAAKVLSDHGVRAAVVNCDHETKLCKKKSVRSYPFVQLLVEGTLTTMETEGDALPTAKLMYDFVGEKSPDSVVNLRLPQQVDDFISGPCSGRESSWGACLVLFTAKFETPLLLKSIAHQLKGNVAVGEVRGSNQALAKMFDVGDFPTVLMVCGAPRSGQRGHPLRAYVKFDGDTKSFDLLLKFAFSFDSKSKCKSVLADARKRAETAAQKLRSVRSLPKRELMKKPISELREYVEGLGISSAGLLEKSDYVSAIISHLASNVKSEM